MGEVCGGGDAEGLRRARAKGGCRGDKAREKPPAEPHDSTLSGAMIFSTERTRFSSPWRWLMMKAISIARESGTPLSGSIASLVSSVENRRPTSRRPRSSASVLSRPESAASCLRSADRRARNLVW